MAIVGGAIMPVIQGKVVDATSPAVSFIVPAFCFAVVGLYALYDLKADPYEMKNLLGKRGSGPLVAKLRKQLAQLVAHSVAWRRLPPT